MIRRVRELRALKPVRAALLSGHALLRPAGGGDSLLSTLPPYRTNARFSPLVRREGFRPFARGRDLNGTLQTRSSRRGLRLRATSSTDCPAAGAVIWLPRWGIGPERRRFDSRVKYRAQAGAAAPSRAPPLLRDTPVPRALSCSRLVASSAVLAARVRSRLTPETGERASQWVQLTLWPKP